MNIIIPMAGIGKRMRPHTLSIPKPLIPVAGKPIVERLVENIVNVVSEKINTIAFVVGHFGEEVEKNLLDVAANCGAKGKIFYQEEALGTAHAVLCAEPVLDGKVVVAFADTLFDADFQLDEQNDATVWVHRVDDPANFGVVKIDEKGYITNFYEKPKSFVSDLAIIGIYYFRDGENLKKELQFLIDNKTIKNNEYQITDALENMKQKGLKFTTDKVNEWLDCGNKDATVYTNQRILELSKNENLVDSSAVVENSKIIGPCYIGKNVVIEDSLIGPYASIGNNTTIKNCLVSNSIIQRNSSINYAIIKNAMIGSYVQYSGSVIDSSIGDYSTIKQNT